MVALTVVFESDLKGEHAEKACQSWAQGLAFLLNAADLELPLQAVFLKSVVASEATMSVDEQSKARETLVRQLKQLELFEIPAVAYQKEVQQQLEKADLSFVKLISADEVHQLFEESAYIVSV